MKNTKGPWNIVPSFDHGHFIVNSGEYPNSVPVALITSDKNSRETNARLIAAAPELLEALNTLIETFSYKGALDPNLKEDAVIINALNVIKKATGGAK